MDFPSDPAWMLFLDVIIVSLAKLSNLYRKCTHFPSQSIHIKCLGAEAGAPIKLIHLYEIIYASISLIIQLKVEQEKCWIILRVIFESIKFTLFVKIV